MTQNISRRDFLKASGFSLGLLALNSMPAMAASSDITKQWNSKKKSGFTMWQLQSHFNTIGNSYVLRTTGGKVIVMDGGFGQEEPFLRGFLGALGNVVDAWFISHPHDDHMGALSEILKDVKDLQIKQIIHSRITDEIIELEKPYNQYCHTFYERLDATTIPVVDLQEAALGKTFKFDDMSIKVLGVANPELKTNPYNNNSMILRAWDKKKSIVFLGDAGIECGNKVLNGQYGSDLDCEYMQMAHHGQRGCNKHFYDSVKFRVCLWPTPTWVWENNQGAGYNTGNLETFQTRGWMQEKGITEHHVSCQEPLYKLD